MNRETFLNRLEPELNSGCLLWPGAQHTAGYGTVFHERRLWKAHRLAWTIANGDIPAGLIVCHKCDTPACANPSHLFLGTDASNAADKVRKGRARHGVTVGEANHNTTTTSEQAMLTRALWDAGVPSREIATRVGISIANVRFIGKRVTWRHLRDHSSEGAPACRTSRRGIA